MIDSFRFKFNKTEYRADLTQPFDLSLPIQAGADNPNCYFTEPVDIQPIRTENFVGSVSEGGACNHMRITLAPHGNGTHTECYGHISDDPAATIHNCLRQFHFLAQVITITPQLITGGDRVIRSHQVIPLLNSAPALVIRTLPNDLQKRHMQYSGTNPPYVDMDLAEALTHRGIEQLLIDLPSIDREQDGGKLPAHKAFWNFPQQPRKQCTVTELIFVPPEVSDGLYLLNLQVTSLQSDASPSKPLLFPLI